MVDTIKCTCGFEIAIIPDKKAMIKAIRDHKKTHNKCLRLGTELFLTKQLLTKIVDKTPQQTKVYVVTKSLHDSFIAGIRWKEADAIELAQDCFKTHLIEKQIISVAEEVDFDVLPDYHILPNGYTFGDFSVTWEEETVQ